MSLDTIVRTGFLDGWKSSTYILFSHIFLVSNSDCFPFLWGCFEVKVQNQWHSKYFPLSTTTKNQQKNSNNKWSFDSSDLNSSFDSQTIFRKCKTPWLNDDLHLNKDLFSKPLLYTNDDVQNVSLSLLNLAPSPPNQQLNRNGEQKSKETEPHSDKSLYG